MRISSTEIGVLVLVGFAGWYGWTHHELEIKQKLGLAPVPKVRILDAQFKCDQRIYCSQMKSCEEARFFIQHCPNTKFDWDGPPSECEERWCVPRGRMFQHLTQ